MQDDAAASTGAEVAEAPSDDPYALYPLSVDDIRTRLFALGISKSKDSIQRYCREGTLDCVKLGMLRRYYATEVSVEDLLETLQNDAAASDSTQLHEATGSMQEDEVQLHAAVPVPDLAKDKDLHAAASTGMQEDAAAGSGTHRGADKASQDPKETEQSRSGESGFHAEMVDFLKDQIRVKDDQIRLKDEQIAAMLERDRETNVLIRNLQARIGDAFGVLVAGKRKDAEWTDTGREAGYTDVRQDEDAP